MASPNQVDRKVPEDTSKRVKPARFADAEQGLGLTAAPAVSWPKAESATVDLAARRLAAEPARTNADVVRAAKAGPTRAGGSPVFIGDARDAVQEDLRKVPLAGPAAVRVEVFDRARTAKSKVDGLLLKVARPDSALSNNRISVEVNYGSFRDAYGGAWSSRLRLVELPECAATTPERSECQVGKPLRSVNNTGAGVVGSDLDLAGGASKMLALQAGGSGGAGNFGATSLSESAAWGGGGSTGDFTWSYPLSVPPANGGPSPTISLAYASSGVDGRTVGANNQASWIGMGFEFAPGQIERRYKPCATDVEGDANNKTRPTGDQCWYSDNASITLNGRASELVRVGTSNTWKLKNDDGSKVEQLFNTGLNNGDDNGEYWKFTSPDGTQFFFGQNRLPGWTSGEETQSVFTVPVYGNHPGEPCNGANFQASGCRQAYKWNVDYAVDVHGNTMSYFYERETNNYARYGDADHPDWYVRAGNLKRIDYGQRSDAIYSTPPLAKVFFDTENRCVGGCSAPTDFQDTPTDLTCDAAPCNQTFSPAFFTRKRLNKIRTEVLNNNGVGFRPVDEWTLRQSYIRDDASTGYAMWLEGITHKGLGATPAITANEVTFDGAPMDNRVDDLSANVPPLKWRRIIGITSESGGKLAVRYMPTNCSTTSLPVSPQANTLRCMPVKGVDEAYPNRIDWFHKYVVDRVTQADAYSGMQPVVTDYEYVGDAAWHFDEIDGIIPVEDKTWSQWRGYGTVITRTGDGTDGLRRKTETRFFRGMHGDRNGSGGTKTVNVTDSRGGSIPDDDRFAGMTRETTTFLDETTRLSTTIDDPWVSAAQATQTKPWGTTVATRADVSVTRTFTYLTPTNVRETKVVKTMATDGTVTQIENQGVVGDPNDDKCTKYTFASNATKYLINLPVRVQQLTVACSVTNPAKGDVLTDSRNYYQSATLGVIGDRGVVTKVEEVNGFTGTAASTATYQTKSTAVYDEVGRVTDATDVKGNLTHTDYVRTGNGPITRVITTDPIGRITFTDNDPAWGAPVKMVDDTHDDLTTEAELDALGRVIKVWGPTRKRGVDSPDSTYSYLISQTGYSVVMTSTLQAPSQVAGQPAGTFAPQYTSKYELYDGLLRLRQTQIASPSGGRSVSTLEYDTQNRIVKRSGPMTNDAPPGFSFLPVNEASLPNQVRTEYDGAGRTTAEILYGHISTGLAEKWRTTTAYSGDQVTKTPPAGGVTTTVTYDPDGRPSKLWQYKAAGVYDETKFSYAKDGQQSVVEDSAGNKWEYFYDDLHRTNRLKEPDRGESTLTYNQYGEVATTTDARGKKLGMTYDSVGRPTEVNDVTTTPQKKLTSWVYDTLKLGLPTSSSRWVGSDEYRTSIVEYDAYLRPTKTRVGIPMIEGGLAGTYDYSATFNFDGSPDTTSMPALASLPAETLTARYNGWGLPISTIGASTYVQATAYNSFAEPLSVTVGATGSGKKSLLLQFTYEEATRRLVTASARPNGGASVANVAYTYDAAGNVTAVSDQPTASGQVADYQCFSYDYLRRMTEAWTPATADCSASGRTVANLGGPAKYWSSYTFDKTGNRKTEQRHELPGEPTTTYNYGTTGHRLNSTSVGGSTLTSYQYDAAGNTTQRVVGGSTQDLEWDAEGNLVKVTEGSKVTRYLNDASGNRLIRRDDTGTTLYLPGQELHLSTANVKSATRYYTHAGVPVAVRTNDGNLTYLASDAHGTATVAMDSVTGTVQKRRSTPFGEDRGAAVVGWPGDKGFVGGTKDQSTGLTHLGAREYDPKLGRFISVDPLTIPEDPQRLNGYAYGNNSPMTNADPSGEAFPADPDAFPPPPAPPANPGNPSGNPGGLSDEDQKARLEAEALKKKSMMDMLVEQGLSFLLDFLGITDIVNCITKGDVGACVSTLIGMIPWGKVFKAGKAIVKGVTRAFDAYKSWQRAIKIADDVIRRTDDLIAAARKKADELAQSVGAGAKKADDAPGGLADNAAGAAGDCAHSFDPDTQVQMADGSTKAIKDVGEGDEVLATDPETGETTTRTVVRKHVNFDTDLTDVTLTGEAGPETLHTTQHHPFWSQTRQAWVDAAQLQPGEHVRALDGSLVTVESVRSVDDSRVMHDLTVSEIHTYYVIVGARPVLVHNCDIIDVYHGTSKNGAKSVRDNGVDTQYADPDKDFGQGFYTTTSREQAETWARSRFGGNGEVMHFRVDLRELAKLNGKIFPDSGGPEFEAFARGQRTGSAPMHGYHWVEGPMVKNVGRFKRGARAELIGQQLSFHTAAAASLLKLVS
ncbi:polymorphic toxin-type HINT domain-containing protein [Dactylosporangium sp. CA-152071]|uniref:polymorphic toxin-type HINT domain-containing protein n=1 Tax=Dactylosporangium sp. CA-152071 TaxID=3239933 RepID=UPI003D92E487